MHTESRWRSESGLALTAVLGLMAGVVVVAVLATSWWMSHYIYASPFEPTELDEKEERALSSKVARIEHLSGASVDSGFGSRPATARELAQQPEPEPVAAREPIPGQLTPEAYSENPEDRTVRFTEREVNALIARDPALGERAAVHLSPGLVSLSALIPMEEDFPLVGGTTVRVTMGLTLAYTNEAPVVAVRGVSLGGIPIPSAWMGDIKGENLVEQFGGDPGFWSSFAAGVDHVQVGDGFLEMRLRE